MSRRTKQKIDLSRVINSLGIIIFFCDNCRKSDLKYRRSDYFLRCGNCVRRGYFCDDKKLFFSDIKKISATDYSDVYYKFFNINNYRSFTNRSTSY